jgi:4-amino-4-deoxy-L-arabinose transferase-like glycosyltransferase
VPVSRPCGSLARRIILSGVLVSLGAVVATAAGQLVDTEGLDCVDFTNAEWAGTPVSQRVHRDPTEPLLGISLRSTHSQFSTICTGWFFNTRPIAATFLLESDDGSDLSIGNSLVVDNSGRHGAEARRGTIVLQPGPHPLRVRYAQHGGDYAFALLWGPRAGPLQPLARSDLSRRALSRVEHVLRPWAASLRAMSLVLIAVLLGVIWRCLWLPVARAIARRVRATHHAVVSDRRRAVLAVLAVASAARILLTLTSYPVVWPDSFSFYAAAAQMVRGNWTSHEIFRTPLFSAFMALFLGAGDTPAMGLTMIATQRLLGIAATGVVYAIARRAFSPATAFYGTLLWTLSPLQLYYETAVASEALFVFLFLLTIWAAVRLVDSARGVAAFALVGLLCGLTVLTRPVAKGLLVVMIAVLWRHVSMTPRRTTRLASMVAAYLLCTVPWMYVNSQTYGFFGISRGEGLGLFMRAFDIERLPVPADTAYPDVAEVARRLTPTVPFMHYRVRDELNYGLRYSALNTDKLMAGLALEAIEDHPIAFAAGVGLDWLRLFVAPHRSVDLCDDAYGPVLCAVRSRNDRLPAFPNQPPAGVTGLKTAVAAYMGPMYWLTPLLSPLAGLGAFLILRRPASPPIQLARVLLLATIVYFSIVSVSFNTVEDRYRLPVDAFILLFAVYALGEAGSLFATSTRRQEPRWRVNSAA